MNDFATFEKKLNALSANLKPANIAKISRGATTALKQSNARRLAQNIEPTGEKFTPRSTKKLFKPQTSAKFLYPIGGSGELRLVHLTAWTVRGGHIIGYDEKCGANRTFIRKKIKRWIISKTAAGELKQSLVNKLTRNKKMFRNSKKQLKTWQDADGFEIGFDGIAARILAIHHYGRVAKINEKSNRLIRYPRRELIGVSKSDMDAVTNKVMSIFD